MRDLTRDRILWNRRPTGSADGGDIDEIVMSGVDVHIEQMGDRCWWIEMSWDGGAGYWSGNFVANARGRMRFMRQEDSGVVWDRDESHEVHP